MSKTVAIVQSNYIPWRGYFDIIRSCDLFVIGDTVQYTTRDWRNRNSIKTASGKRWLTIPVRNMPQATTMIDEVQVADPEWVTSHIDIIRQSYRKAAAFNAVSAWLFELLESVRDERSLTCINTRLLVAISERLGITTPIVGSTDLVPRDRQTAIDKNLRTMEVCRAAGATCYLSGPAARAYLDEALLGANGIDVAWMSYERYRDYPQLWGAFDPNVSIVDLLLNTGDQARDFLVPGGEAAESCRLVQRDPVAARS